MVLIEVANAMFRNKSDWKNVSDEDKSTFSFIFNRYFSKKYPVESLCLNTKGMNKSTIMDLWFEFNRTKQYPNWFWSKSPYKKEDEKSKSKKGDKTDDSLMMEILNISSDDLYILKTYYTDLYESELKYYKSIQKENKK